MYFNARGKLTHQHGESSVPYEGDTLAVRVSDLRRNHVQGSPQAMLARFPDTECIWPSCAWMCRAHKLVMVPESHETIAVSKLLAQLMRHHLRLHRHPGDGPALLHQFVPILHAALCVFQESPMFIAFEQGKST